MTGENDARQRTNRRHEPRKRVVQDKEGPKPIYGLYNVRLQWPVERSEHIYFLYSPFLTYREILEIFAFQAKEEKRSSLWDRSSLISGSPKKPKNLLAEWAKDEGSQNAVVERLIRDEAARKGGAIIEQQSLPVIYDIVQSELRKALAQQRIDLREEMQQEFTNEIKPLHRASDNRLAALLVRVQRDSNIARRLIYANLARSYGPDFAKLAYEDARERAGKEMARRDEVDV